MSKPETVALIVASLAAASSLLNALVSLFNAWLDNRRLKITIKPDPWAHPEVGDLVGESFLTFKIDNPARTPNSVAQLWCKVDGKGCPLAVDPPDLLRSPLGPYAAVQGRLKLQADQLPPKFEKIEFTVAPIRGKRRTFRFVRQDFLPEF